MTLPTGPRSLQQIQTEFGGISPTGITEYYRGGAYVLNNRLNAAVPTTGQIALNSFVGSASRGVIYINITSNTYNLDVYSVASVDPFYIAGSSDIVVTINAGVYVGSVSPSSYSLTVSTSFAAGDTVTIINNGVIQGSGGTGGSQNSGAGVAGGTAAYIQRPTIIANNGFMIAGGGGGGGGAVNLPYKGGATNGGGGGGGAGFNGGTGGYSVYGYGGTGTLSAGGAGSGAGGYAFGGTGGAPGAAGSPGGNTSGGGGAVTGGPGGAGGYYLIGVANTTFTATGTRIGNVA